MNRKQGKDAALSAVKGAAPGTVLLVDFDHTLLLANSSEEFVRSARPYLLAAVVLKLLEYLKPWNLLRTPEARRIARETLRVRIICLLFPFALAAWRGRAGKIAEKWLNSQLLKALRQRADCRIVITSLGFKSLLAPVLRHMSLPEGWSLDAGDIWVGASERHRSKWDRLRDRHDAAALQAAVLITDSGDDLDLVERVDNAHVVNWPEGERAQVFNHYMPFQYLVKVKHGDWNYPRSVILGDEFVQLVLCLSWLSVFPLVHSFAISLLLLSFWMIYELGYMENDLIAEESEVEPVLGPNFAAGRSMIAFREPWVWAIATAVPGILLVSALPAASGWVEWRLWPSGFSELLWHALVEGDFARNLLLWIGLLVLLRFTYAVYNRIDKFTRTWVYLPLQLFKGFGFALVTPVGLAGYIAFFSQALARWVVYFFYRYGQSQFPGMQWTDKIRLGLVVTLFATLALSPGVGAVGLYSPQVIVIILWVMVRSRRSLWKILKSVRPVKRDTWTSLPR